MYRVDRTDPRILLNLSDKLVNSVQWQFCVERLGDSMFLGRSKPCEENSLMQKIKFKNFCLDSRAVDAICLDQYYLLDDIHDQLLAYLTTL